MINLNFIRYAVLILIAFAISIAPADAHKKKHPEQVPQAAEVMAANSHDPASAPTAPQSNRMAGMAEMEEDRSSMSTGERLLDWLGRLHPMVVHFPLAFLPAALFTAVVGRRRPGFAKPVQFLVVAGGITALFAMVLGWFDGGLTLGDTDPLLRFHRWIGTGIGIVAAALALWAWRRPGSDRSNGMLAGLAILTIALVVQGWFGGAMVHGIDHMNW